MSLLQEEVARAVSTSRATREQVAGVRLRTRPTRLALEWQRAHARRQMTELEGTRQTLDELGFDGRRLHWLPVGGELDDVLVPLD
jgi:hypothetical protein